MLFLQPLTTPLPVDWSQRAFTNKALLFLCVCFFSRVDSKHELSLGQWRSRVGERRQRSDKCMFEPLSCSTISHSAPFPCKSSAAVWSAEEARRAGGRAKRTEDILTDGSAWEEGEALSQRRRGVCSQCTSPKNLWRTPLPVVSFKPSITNIRFSLQVSGPSMLVHTAEKLSFISG